MQTVAIGAPETDHQSKVGKQPGFSSESQESKPLRNTNQNPARRILAAIKPA
jgi:hypothetical protein